MEAGAAVANLGLGLDGMGASAHWFGSTPNADGQGSHEMGAIEWMDQKGQAAGNGVSDMLGLDPKSAAGQFVSNDVRGLVDAAGISYAVPADIIGGISGAGQAVGQWIGDAIVGN
jgi:hypothetical protein